MLLAFDFSSLMMTPSLSYGLHHEKILRKEPKRKVDSVANGRQAGVSARFEVTFEIPISRMCVT